MSQGFTLTVLAAFAVANGYSQGVNNAAVTTPVVQTSMGKEAKLLCTTTGGKESSNPTSIRNCIWERVSTQTLIVNFNDINSQPGLFSGVAGYSYSGEGFRDGECGIKISVVKDIDISKWQCTLITDDKLYRGYVDLVKAPVAPENTTMSVAASRTSIDANSNNENRPRPIITSYNDARAIVQPEIVIHNVNGEGTDIEVKVESAGLIIKPRRGKLIVFE